MKTVNLVQLKYISIVVWVLMIGFVVPSRSQEIFHDVFLEEIQRNATDITANEYTRTFTIEKSIAVFDKLPQVCTFETMYTDESKTGNYPTIRIRRISVTDAVFRPSVDAIYQLGAKNNYVKNSYRIIRHAPEVHTIAISIIIPKGIKLYIREASMQTTVAEASDIRYRFLAHGLDGAFNRLSEISNCASNGTKYCIVVPKRTLDGVWCCFHDDDNINGLYYSNGQVVCKKTIVGGSQIYIQYDEEGNVIGNSAMPITSLTWNFVEKLKYRGYTNQNESVMLLDDFFSICSVTGVHPVFSVHPGNIFTANSCAGLKELRAMLEKYNLLDKFVIKLSSLNSKYVDILGGDIEAYNLIANDSTFERKLETLKNSNIACRKCIEGAFGELTADRVKMATDAGVSVGVWRFGNKSADNQIIKEFIDIGVSEFTVSMNNSFGLNWYTDTSVDKIPQLLIPIDYSSEHYYDMKGLRVVQFRKGIYVKKGKKVYINGYQ